MDKWKVGGPPVPGIWPEDAGKQKLVMCLTTCDFLILNHLLSLLPCGNEIERTCLLYIFIPKTFLSIELKIDVK